MISIGDDIINQHAMSYKKGDAINYHDFIMRLKYENAMLEIIDYLFVSFKSALDSKHLNGIAMLFNNQTTIDEAQFYN
jgi:hypothetical protein